MGVNIEIVLFLKKKLNGKMTIGKYDSRGNASLSSRLGAHITAVGYTVVQIIAVIALEMYVVIPAVFQDSKIYYLNILLFGYLAISVVGNYYFSVATDVSCKKLVYPGDQRRGFYYCQSCEQNSPPRAHHCGFCETCVAKQDHHCFFIANCVGLANVRFFILFCLFVCAASTYSTVVNLLYLHKNMSPLIPLSVEGMLRFVVPVTLYKWWIGSVSLLNLVIVTVTWFCFLQVLVTSGFVSFEMMLTYCGQTTYEWRHQISHYNLGWMQNYRDICGKHWYLWWFFPIFQRQPLDLRGDEYATRYYAKPAKGI